MSVRNYKLAGCLWSTPVDENGAVNGDRRKIGNCYPMTVQVTTTSADMNSALCDSAGQILDSKNEIDTIEGEATLRQWSAREVGWAIGATPVSLTGTGSTITGDTAANDAPEAGVWVELGAKNLSDVVIKDSTGTTTYTLNTDYQLNEKLGLYTIVEGGSITAGDELTYDATVNAETGYQLDIGTVMQRRVRLEGELRDIRTGDKFEFLAYMVEITATNGLTLISDPDTDWEELGLNLKYLTPAGYTSPAYIKGMPL